MSDTSDHDLLLRLISKFDSFYDEFRRVSNGTGFPRCAERLARIEALEKELAESQKNAEKNAGILHKRIDSGNSRFWWLIAFIFTQAVGFILTLIKGGFFNKSG